MHDDLASSDGISAGGVRGALADTVAVICGATGGIGAGVAREFALAGATVMVHYRTQAEAANRLAADIAASGGIASTHAADLVDPDAVSELLTATVAEFGRIDSIVNCAGTQPVSPLDGMTLAEWRSVVDENAAAGFVITQAAVDVMRETGGSLTHLASIEGTHPAVGHAHYSAAKAAMIMFARSAAVEYGALGIRVNTVSPGLIDRPGLTADWPDGVQRYRAAAPLGRLGTPADIGKACVFLASDSASWITGTNLVVDGGVASHATW